VFEKQVPVGAKGEGNVIWIAEVAMILLMPVNNYLFVQQTTVVLTIKDITNATRGMFILVTIKQVLDLSFALEIALKLRDEGYV